MHPCILDWGARLFWQSRSTLGTTLVVLQRFLVLSLYLSTWNFETFRFLGHMQTPILDCKPTWPFSARKMWYNRPTCQPKAFRHRLCIHLGPWHFNYRKHMNSFGINYIIPYFANFFDNLFSTCVEILIIIIKLNSEVWTLDLSILQFKTMTI
jgi:hypothetical protein